MADPAPRIPWVMILAAGAAAIAVLASIYLLQPKPPAETETETASANAPVGCVLSPGKQIGGPIDLIDESGAAVTQKHFNEGMSLVYFGYTFCPDVCPLSLQAEKKALDLVGQEAGVIQPVMISLDPERDTPQTLAAYVKSDGFPNGLIGLTGSKDQVAAAAKAFRIVYKRIDDPKSAAGYTVGHSSYFYLMDDEWRARALYPSTLSPHDAAQCIKAGIAQTSPSN